MENFEVCDRDIPKSLLERYLASDAIAVDTETMGLNPLRDRLCLVQLCDTKGYSSAVRIERGQSSAPNLQQLLEIPSILKIFHFARFDLATLSHHLDIDVTPVFCTKIASKLARTYSPRHGLKELVKEIAGIDLDKTAQSSDWGNVHDLSDEQLAYAANDVRYLHELSKRLTLMLQREGRWYLAEECFQCLPTFIHLDLLQYQNIFEH
ncbi:ribonuclease H-like domain-containing protein [Leptothoe spongobia]|uniref:Ribonuclease D n=1 Tax=Leptothoe spongobia TAU-MAC 1115 TaxID=1967444 RepID=A0A947DFC6_9CYAN|nr:ribonuclease H-like domain-containing protein [Leptothoe spongobia]MBT9315875.1 ribonuclease D [Leptothoe spongobia TAU-MAC 1115]